MNHSSKFQEIFELAHEISAKTEMAVTFDYHGHVHWITLEVHSSKTNNYIQLYSDVISLKRDSLEKLDTWIDFLKGLVTDAVGDRSEEWSLSGYRQEVET